MVENIRIQDVLVPGLFLGLLVSLVLVGRVSKTQQKLADHDGIYNPFNIRSNVFPKRGCRAEKKDYTTLGFDFICFSFRIFFLLDLFP